MPQQADGLTALTLGNVEFFDWEVPEEIDHFGGTQKLAVHEFPGGQRTVQKMGAFPPRIIRWHGVFWEGDNGGNSHAQARVDQVNQMRVAGEVYDLTFGAYTYQVVIHEFAVTPQSIYRQPYSIAVVPVRDNSASSQPVFNAPPSTGTTQLAQQNSYLANTTNQFSQVANTPASQNAVNNLSTFQQSLNNALQQANGNVLNVNTTQLQTQLKQAQSSVGPLGNSLSSPIASNALINSAALGVISNTLSSSTGGLLTKLTCVNPDLKALAVQYYGDASLWPVIAKANKLAIPRPVGIFQGDTALKIPQINTANAS